MTTLYEAMIKRAAEAIDGCTSAEIDAERYAKAALDETPLAEFLDVELMVQDASVKPKEYKSRVDALNAKLATFAEDGE